LALPLFSTSDLFHAFSSAISFTDAEAIWGIPAIPMVASEMFFKKSRRSLWHMEWNVMNVMNVVSVMNEMCERTFMM
jgi:hypothetical protein